MSDWLNLIKSINDKYLEAKNRFDALLALNRRFSDGVLSHVTTEIISGNLERVSDALRKTNAEDYPMLRDVLILGNQYLDSVSAVMSYKEALLSSNQGVDVTSSIAKVKKAQKTYDKTKVTFQSNYSCTVDSLDTLHNAISIHGSPKTCSLKQAHRQETPARMELTASYTQVFIRARLKIAMFTSAHRDSRNSQGATGHPKTVILKPGFNPWLFFLPFSDERDIFNVP